MIIGFYNPALDSLSGGERYSLALASHWSKNHEVSIFWGHKEILIKAQERLRFNLSDTRVTQNIFLGTNVLKKIALTRQYDLLFILSDGSIPTTFAKHNIIHFQIPFPSIAISLWKLRRYDAVVCNSVFTKKHLDKKLGEKSLVIYPPVAPIEGNIVGKQKVILSVGRFSDYHQTKKQHILIQAFIQATSQDKLKGWRLILAGGLLPSDEPYFHKLNQESDGYAIDLLPNISHQSLSSLYRRATLYWHAAGYGETDPMLMEHFGISTVEAMSAGCIPLSYDGGGQPEIIESGTSGVLWHTVDELIDASEQLIHKRSLMLQLRKNALSRSELFDEGRFFHAYDSLLREITS